jgi:hypothetical protein
MLSTRKEYKRDKRIGDAGRCAEVTLGSIRMREPAYNISAHFRVGRGARIVLYLRLSTPPRNPQNTETAYHPQREI